MTVDRKDGVIKEHSDTLVTDLPGIYSMSPYSSEEIVTRNFVLDEHPKGIINIVDATNIERNMYLTMQLMELEIPMVVALNMMDEMRVNGGSVRVNELEAFLGVPVVPISAAKGEGIAELVEHALHVAKYQEAPEEVDFCSAEGQESAVHRCIHAIMHLIEDHAKEAGIPVRFAASKLAENDELVLEKLKLSQNEKELLEHINLQMEEECKVERSSAVAGMRFNYIQRACEDTVLKPHESRERVRSRKIDQVLTGKYTGIPAFIAIMGLVFWLTFNVIGAFLQDLLQQGIDQVIVACSQALDAAGVNGVLKSLIVDGTMGPLLTAAAKAHTSLVVPDTADLQQLKCRPLENYVDYGGYRALLQFPGKHQANHAAMAVEIALALWREYHYEIPDEAIETGLRDAKMPARIEVMRRHPLLLLDGCHNADGTAALAATLKEAG